ncbi:hypothetical protein C8R44DRAFT_782997 [Mycena epipterygia]|nr:hypothetical protein C8R44DRAFT_782997 [Mycena epipterygia]
MIGAANILSFFGLLSSSSATWIPDSRSVETGSSLESRATTTLNNGTTGSFVFGKVGNMTWAASGTLTKGCSSSSISNCYGMYLTSNASAMLDTDHLDSPRQRNEWHFPTCSSDQPFSYSWKQYLDPSAGSSTHFFHLMQVFGISEGEPLVALDALSNYMKIVDFINTSCGSSCPSTPLSNYLGKYTSHTISGIFGPSGSLNYSVTGASGKILSYSRTGGLGAAGGYVKFGTYRLTFTPNMTTVNAMVGDWQTYYQ